MQAQHTSQTRVKICCISSLAEARLAVEAEASAVGLVSHMPSGPGVITEAEIQRILPHIPPHIETFLLTSLTRPQEIIAQHKRCPTTTLQFVDYIAPSAYTLVRTALPEVKLVQVIHVTGQESLKLASDYSQLADILLLDSGNPQLPVKELGGTGRQHDWSISAEIVSSVSSPVFLAGGLSAENVTMAINTVRPFGVDVCSGVREAKRLNEIRLRDFMANVPITM